MTRESMAKIQTSTPVQVAVAPAKKETEEQSWVSNVTRKVQDMTNSAYQKTKTFVNENQGPIAKTVGAAVVLAGLAYGGYSYYTQKTEVEEMEDYIMSWLRPVGHKTSVIAQASWNLSGKPIINFLSDFWEAAKSETGESLVKAWANMPSMPSLPSMPSTETIFYPVTWVKEGVICSYITNTIESIGKSISQMDTMKKIAHLDFM